MTGPSRLESGSFFSAKRGLSVGYTVSYPSGHRRGDVLGVILILHGFDANHTDAFHRLRLDVAQAQLLDGTTLKPFVLAAVDGGNGYWHPRTDGDDPQGMLIDEFLPLLSRRHIETSRVGLLGWSMGGYGALLLAETYPDRVVGVAAESPAIWPSYAASQEANPAAFDSAADWAGNDVVGHLSRLGSIPVRIDEGTSDPFLQASEQLQALLPAGDVHFEPGGHNDTFWAARGPAELAFLQPLLPRAWV